MAYSEIPLMQTMTDQQRLLFQARYQPAKKSTTVGVLLALFLGGLGVHHFYLHRVALGVLYIVFCWTFIPAIIAVLEAFVMSERVDDYNANTARELAAEVLSLDSGGPTAGATAMLARPASGPAGLTLLICLVGFVLLAALGSAISRSIREASPRTTAGPGASARVSNPELTVEAQELRSAIVSAGETCDAPKRIFKQGNNDGSDFWNLECQNGHAYMVRVNLADRSTRVLSCSALKTLTQIECFQAF
jgi:TM2 domain-containing membrane protein YozV